MGMGGRIGGQGGYEQPPYGGGYPAGPGKGRAPFGQPRTQQQPPYGGGFVGYQQPQYGGGYPSGPGKGRAPSGQPPAVPQTEQSYQDVVARGGGGINPVVGTNPDGTPRRLYEQPVQTPPPATAPPPPTQTSQVPGRPTEDLGMRLVGADNRPPAPNRQQALGPIPMQPGSYGSPGKGMRPQPYGGGFGGGFGGYQPSPYQISPGAPGKGQRRSPFPQSPYGGGFGGYQPSPYGGGFGGYQPSPYGGGFGGGYGGYQQSPYGGGFQGRSMGIGSLLRPNMQGLERQRVQAMMGINPYMR